jgi:hypothetical protein
MSKLPSPPRFLRDTKTLPTCAKMALPTKKEFLATLEPVEHPDCSICREPMTSPVRFPCQGTHEFCKACITERYNQSNSAECPMCRQTLFSKDVADVADVAGVTFPARASPELRITQVYNTFRASGMGDITRTLHNDIEWGYENLRLLAPFAQHMLAGTLSVQEPGAVRIDLSLVGLRPHSHGERTAANCQRRAQPAQTI